jgi:hypothetical protein
MKTFFTGLLIFIIVWYLFKAVTRLVAMFFASRTATENSKQTRKKNVTIDYSDAPKKHFGKDSVEYVDFEEVK